jgi:inorganic triphosphatase YgiF
MDDSAGEFIETERKYEAESDFVLPGLSGVPGVAAVSPPQTYELSAVYIDTEDLRLIGAKVTLRRRTGGTDAGWHLKLPAGGDSRREIHAPLGPGVGTVPADLLDRVSGWTGGQPLQPIARLDTIRTVRHLTGGDGQVLAEIADDLVTGSLPAGRPAGWQVAASWREIEVELVTGSPDLLDAVALRLQQAGASPSAAASKLGRLLATRDLSKG